MLIGEIVAFIRISCVDGFDYALDLTDADIEVIVNLTHGQAIMLPDFRRKYIGEQKAYRKGDQISIGTWTFRRNDLLDAFAKLD